MRCVRAAWRGHLGWIAAVTGLALGLGGYWGVADILVSGQPVGIEIHNVAILSAPPGTIGRTMEIDITSSPSPHCTRTSQHLMYQTLNGRRRYYPIGSALNGVGFPGSVYDFTLVLSLPMTLDPGEYEYIQRSAFNCSWLGGFIQRRIAYQSPPVAVHIGRN